jgi:hypothetical protein
VKRRPYKIRVHLTRTAASGSVLGYVDAPIFAPGTSGTVWGWRVFRHPDDAGSTQVTPYLVESTARGGQVPGDDVLISTMPTISTLTADGTTAGDTLDLGQDRRIFGDGLTASAQVTTTGAGQVHLSYVVWGEVWQC